MNLKAAILSSLFLVATASYAANMRVGTVDMGTLAPEMKKMQQELRGSTNETKSMREALKAKREKLQSAPDTMTQADKDALSAEIKADQAKLKERVEAMRGEMKQKREAMHDSFRNKYKAAIKKVAEDKKLDLVVPKNGLLYAHEEIDITADVQKAAA